MRPWLRPLLGLLTWTTFSANSLFPGLLHRCDGDPVATPVVATAAAGHGIGGMDMGGMDDMSAMSSHQHGSHRPSPGRTGDCHCVGHSCCSVTAAAPAVAAAVMATVIAVPVARPAAQAVAPLTRPAFLLPQAQAPPTRA